ncbi:MAG: N-acetyltransferase [Candidatus Eremiobacteraeota bacterium]|nr:N-acetyltransferase [Candidatus Eremiobacteraeota bacterium]
MKPHSFQIRPAGNSDCPQVAEIYQESLDRVDSSMEVYTSAQNFERQIAGFHDREIMLVLETEEGVQGYGVVKKYSDRVGYRVACETSIYFRDSATGRGYGGALQKALMDKAREFQYHHIVAKIWTSNEGSLRFHERFGYRLVGVQKEIGFLGGRWRDVSILQCILSDVPPFRPDLG